MKRIFTISAMIFLLGSSLSAQELGIRFGVGTGGNVAVDGVFGIGDWSRIHGDVTFGNGVGIDLLWNFVYKQLGEEAFNWYAGVGPFFWIGDPFGLGVAGEIGIEYQFKFPISLSLDWRPSFRIIENTDFDFGGFGLNIRYVF
ncbi:MAG TPA: outer membrane insertion C- signal [Calditrichaeota bacterium]|nr:outer membrane insertion C- signal [Calditrichota bacterium]